MKVVPYVIIKKLIYTNMFKDARTGNMKKEFT